MSTPEDNLWPDPGLDALLHQEPRERTPMEEFLHIGGKWAALMPPEAWTPGAPPQARDRTIYVAVRMQNGKILTGSLLHFFYRRLRLETRLQYGHMKEWLIFGEMVGSGRQRPGEQ